LPIATNVVTPTVDLENAPSPSLDFIVVDFAMLVTIDFPTFESYVCQSRCVHTPTCLQGCFNVVKTVEELVNVMETSDELQSFQKVTKDPHWINVMEQDYSSLAHNERWILVNLPHGC
jgi:NADH:ubiquinone oxidoreductase subunit F (NADH-binding)